jgi:hypothetical protein
VGPFLMLEYVSRNTKRKDYDDNMQKYEHELKVPYYLLFQPDVLEWSLYRHTGKKYVSVKPDDNGRCAIPELELEVGLLDGWIRFWFRGELLPLPADLLRQLQAAVRRADESDRQRQAAVRRADESDRQREQAEQLLAAAQTELTRLRQELEEKNRRRNNHK